MIAAPPRRSNREGCCCRLKWRKPSCLLLDQGRAGELAPPVAGSCARPGWAAGGRGHWAAPLDTPARASATCSRCGEQQVWGAAGVACCADRLKGSSCACPCRRLPSGASSGPPARSVCFARTCKSRSEVVRWLPARNACSCSPARATSPSVARRRLGADCKACCRSPAALVRLPAELPHVRWQPPQTCGRGPLPHEYEAPPVTRRLEGHPEPGPQTDGERASASRCGALPSPPACDPNQAARLAAPPRPDPPSRSAVAVAATPATGSCGR